MTYILQMVSGKDVRDIEFPARPVFAEVDSAIRSFSMDSAKYVDEEGDLCTLTERTFGDFLSVAQSQVADSTILRIQLPAEVLSELSKCDECPPSPSASQCSSISADWTVVDQDNLEGPRDSGAQPTWGMQSDTAKNQESWDESPFDGSQALIPADGRSASDATSDSREGRQMKPEAADTSQPVCPAATVLLETEMPTPASVSNVELTGVQALSGHASEQGAKLSDACSHGVETPAAPDNSEQGAELSDASTHGVETPAAPDNNGVPLSQQPCFVATAVVAALLGGPLLGVPLFIAAQRQYRRSNGVSRPSTGHS